jgi:hypothetical protein
VETPSIRVVVKEADALKFPADVLVLKYAQSLLGVDSAVYAKLGAAGITLRVPKVGDYKLFQSRGAIGADSVLFLGVKGLRDLGYGEIREFGRRALATLRTAEKTFAHVALTIHGPGYGLDETEAFKALVAGVIEAIARNDYPPGLETVSFVEIDRGRVERLNAVLSKLMPKGVLEQSRHGGLGGLGKRAKDALKTVGHASAAKDRVFVAMPFAEAMNDTFHYGIQNAAHAAGLLAERADLATFTGDVMEWVRERIAGAKLVVADLTGGNPNVYLEVGYAWGKGIPTVLLAKKAKDLKFDVQGQRCIVYSSIKDLEQKLATELKGL